jgi:hypothetical protein
VANRDHRPWPITLRPDTCSHNGRMNMDRSPPAQGLGHPSVAHLSEVVLFPEVGSSDLGMNVAFSRPVLSLTVAVLPPLIQGRPVHKAREERP